MDDSLCDEMVSLIPKLRAHAFVLTHSSSDVDDVVQETLTRAWRFRHTFEPGSNLKAWLFRILRNVYLAGLHGPKLVADPEGRLVRNLRTEPDQEWRIQFGELAEALSELSEPTRQAVLLVIGCGFTYEEAAEACSCSVGTVKSRVSRGRERLVQLIHDGRKLQPARNPRPPRGWRTARTAWSEREAEPEDRTSYDAAASGAFAAGGASA